MKRVVVLIFLTYALNAVDLMSLKNENQVFLKEYEQNIMENRLTYETKVFYELSHEAKELLENVKWSKRPYSLVLKAFDLHTTMQNGMFSILDFVEKKEYMKGHKNYLNALFQFTLKPMEIKETFNRWINYKRTLFDRENLRLTHPRMSAKQDIIKRKQKELARVYQERPLNVTLVKELKLDIENFEKSLSYDLSKLSINSKISYLEIASILRPHELYIDFAKIGDFYYLFTLDKEAKITLQKLKAFAIEEGIKEIQEDREKIINRENFADIAKAKQAYEKLYYLLFKSIKLKSKSSLIISPDGLLNLLPFEALYQKKYLIEKLDIQYIPSAKELIKLHQISKKCGSEIVIFANPSFNNKIKLQTNVLVAPKLMAKRLTPSFHMLEGTLIEANKIKTLFPSALLLSNTDATEENLLKTISPKILHIATHGFFLKDTSILNPMLKSGIVLSGANSSIKNFRGEGIVTSLELSEINLKGTALVVLSACETGIGKIEEAEGVAGLSKAFIRAGAREVIMSLWSVSDASTALLMKKFYENIKRGNSHSLALNNAKKWMISNNKSHPYYWAGFVSSGVSQ
jgi:CHAT domain-containing protein